MSKYSYSSASNSRHWLDFELVEVALRGGKDDQHLLGDAERLRTAAA